MMENLYLYVHIPFCVSKCDYCDFFSVPIKSSISDDYIAALLNELDFYVQKYDVKNLETIYIGGGTPSLLSVQQLERLLNGIKSRFNTNPKEITIEMNPESIKPEKIIQARELGVTRISVGIQSLTDNCLKSVHRKTTRKINLEALETIKKYWTGEFNLDLIAGLPEQSLNEFILSLRECLSYNPDHVSMYSLTIEEGTPLFTRCEKIDCFNEDEIDNQWLKGREILFENNYCQYEVSNFCKKGKESLHNMSYWTQKSYLGIGSGACGTIYEKDKALRWNNKTNIEDYIKFWTKNKITEDLIPAEIEHLSKDVLEFEFLMMGLRTLKGLNFREYKDKFSDDEKFAGDLRKRLSCDINIWNNFVENKWIYEYRDSNGDDFIALSSEGILYLNILLRALV